MRTAMPLLFVSFLISGLVACGDDGSNQPTTDVNGFGGNSSSQDTNTTPTDPGDDKDTDDTASDADSVPDTAGPDDAGDTEGEGDAADVADDVADEDTDEDTGDEADADASGSEDILCEVDADCAGKLGEAPGPTTCDGLTGNNLLLTEACSDEGVCKFEGRLAVCCTETSECASSTLLGACETSACSQSECVVEQVDGCCETNAECADLATDCCMSAFCNVDNTCEVDTLEGCCQDSSDCDDGVEITTDTCTEACVTDGCLNVATGCGDATYYVNKDFDDGTLQLLPTTDNNPNDSVEINTIKGNAVSPKYAVYFGDPECETYYNGPMTDCVPNSPFGTDSTPVELKLQTAQFALSAESGAYLGFWVKMSAEPPVSVDFGDGLVLLDTDFLSVSVTSSAGTEVIWKSTDPDALGAANTTEGQWRHQAANLSSYAGQAISLTFRFFTDGASNYNITPGGDPWVGAFIDDIQVTSTCEQANCDGAGSACPSDGDGCTQDVCTPYALGSGGVCAYPTASPGTECNGCGVPADCGNDACLNYTCDDGICGATVDASCCETISAFPVDPLGGVSYEGFESGALNGWLIDDPYPDDNIGWQVTPVLSHEGTFTLYFGDPTTFNYVAQPSNPSVATAWTPIFEVPSEPFQIPMASFWLWMSTEYDGALEAPDPESKYDRLSIHLQPAGIGETVEVWNSVTTVQNSTAGKWVQIGVDLSGFEGTDARLGFKFDSGDAPGTFVANNAGGVRVDTLTIATACGEDACLTASDCADEDPCTVEYCDLGTCVSVVEDENCCFVDADCDDDNTCTVNECVDGLCNNYYDDSSATKLNCCPNNDADWIGEYVATFEDGDDDFMTIDMTSPVVWNVVNDFGADGSSSSYNFANPSSGTYSNPAGGASYGALVSAPILVPPLTKGNPYGEFMLFMDTEWNVNDPDSFVGVLNIDELTVSVATDVNGDGVIDLDSAIPWWTSEYLQNTTRGEWVHTRIDLAEFRGEEIQLVFEFTTDDGTANGFAGPYVDNVTFGTTCLTSAAVQCIYGGDCSPQDECKDVSCSDSFKCVQVPKSTPECCEPFIAPQMTIDFEGDNSAEWTNTACESEGGADDPDSVWQFANQEAAAGIPPKDGDHVLYFGNGEHYGGTGQYGSCDSIASPAFELTADLPWTVRIWTWLDIGKSQEGAGGEPNWSDTFSITIRDTETGAEEAIWIKLADVQCSDYDFWKAYDIDVSQWAGSSIQLVFSFDSFDTLENDGKGIAIDKIEFTQGCPEIP